MSILVPEIADTFGGLDDVSFETGDAFDAYILRTIARSGNRLVTKGHPIANCMWPVDNSIGDEVGAIGAFEGVGRLEWNKVFEFHAPKKPMLHRARVHVYADITDGAVMQMQIITGRSEARRDEPESNARNVLTMTGSGAYKWYELDELPISFESYDRFEIWIRGLPVDELADEVAYGAPNQFTILDPAGLERWRSIEEFHLAHDPAGAGTVTWKNSHGTSISSTNYVSAGSYVEFRTAASGGGEAISRRTMTEVQRDTSANAFGRIRWDIPLNTRELGEAQFHRHVQIKKLGAYAIGAISVYARPIGAEGV